MKRHDVEQRIAACERCKTECCDQPAVVELMDARLDLLHELHDAIPEQRDTADPTPGPAAG